jgi:hypothetical protein
MLLATDAYIFAESGLLNIFGSFDVMRAAAASDRGQLAVLAAEFFAEMLLEIFLSLAVMRTAAASDRG